MRHRLLPVVASSPNLAHARVCQPLVTARQLDRRTRWTIARQLTVQTFAVQNHSCLDSIRRDLDVPVRCLKLCQALDQICPTLVVVIVPQLFRATCRAAEIVHPLVTWVTSSESATAFVQRQGVRAWETCLPNVPMFRVP